MASAADRDPHRSHAAITDLITDLPRHTLPIWLDAHGEARVLHRFRAQAGQPVLRADEVPARVALIRLEGIDEDAVLRVRILHGARLVYDIAGYIDTRGRKVSAGSLVASMAWLDGREGMTISVAPMQLPLAALTVEVQALIADESSMRAAVRVELLA